MTRPVDIAVPGRPHWRQQAIDVVLALTLAALAFFANWVWVKSHRLGLALNIDEAGYITQAIAYANALKYGGVLPWLHALAFPTKFAPLSPIVTSVLMASVGTRESIAFATNLVFYAGLLLLVYWWVRLAASRSTAVAAVLIIATLPDVVLYARTYLYGIPTAFFFVLANLAYYKSKRFSSWGWAVLAGVALGFLLLSRTMTIAFLPVFAFVWFLDSRKVLRANLRNIGVAIVGMIVVAGPWYALNFHEIFGYLFSFGYGVNSKVYSAQISVLSLAYLDIRFRNWADSFYFVHFFIVFVFFLIALVGAIFRLIRRRDGGGERSAVTGDEARFWVPASIVLLCMAILYSSRNIGTGFDLPLFPLMTFCVAVEIDRRLTRAMSRGLINIGMSLCALCVAWIMIHPSRCDTLPGFIAHPFLGSTQKNLCEGQIDQYLRDVDEFDRAPWAPVSDSDQRAWRALSAVIAERLHDIDKRQNLVIYGTRNRLMNVNTVSLALMQKYGYVIRPAQIDPATVDGTLDAYTSWYDRTSGGTACAVVMTSNTSGDFPPLPDLDILRQVLVKRGLTLASQFPTPEKGMSVELWKSEKDCGNDGS
jgi:hypothetical protein